jgi:ABC-2 type transport system permease protein
VRIFRSGLRKLVRRPASYVTLGMLVGLLALVFIAVGASARQLEGQEGGADALLLVTFPGAYQLVLGFILGLGGLLAVLYGATIAGSEWTWGTLKSAVARGESRSWYLLATFGSIAVLVGVGLVVAYVLGVVAAIVGAILAGVPTDGLSDTETLGSLPEGMARSWIALSEQAAIGFAVATVTRSQIAGIGVGIAAYFAEQFASIFVGDIVKWFPFNAANAAIVFGPSSSVGGQATPSLEPNVALVVVVAWLVGALAVTALFTERAEIGG